MNDYREILEQALLSEKGLRVSFKDSAEAHRFRHGCNRLRKQERIDDAREKGVPKEHGKSQFDDLLLRWRKDYPCVVTIEHGAKVTPLSVEELDEMPAKSSAGVENNG